MIDLAYTGVAIDYIYVNNPNSYGIYPSLFYQRSSASDISGDMTSTIPIKHWWFRVVEMYARYINLPLNRPDYIMLIILVVVLGVIIWLAYGNIKLLNM